MSHKIRALLLLALLIGGAFVYVKFSPAIFTSLPRVEKIATDAVVKQVQKQVLAPQPLKVSKTGGVTPPSTSPLSIEGVIAETNRERAKNGLPALKENALLDASAKLKTNDMFTNQYFAHESPAGKGPADLAGEVGYDYILIGENLALGDFYSNEDLVNAWMASPGHRANILNTRYTEIGVSVRRSMYEGRMTWIATQEFGMPVSACPQTDSVLAGQIDANKQQIDAMSQTLASLQAEINATNPHDPSYNQKVNQYNDLVVQYNALVVTTKAMIAQYNNEVTVINTCIKGQ